MFAPMSMTPPGFPESGFTHSSAINRWLSSERGHLLACLTFPRKWFSIGAL